MNTHFWEMVYSSHYIPHGHCYLWQPSLVGLHVVSNGIIALAYASIPLTLFCFAYKHRWENIYPSNQVFLLFSAFISLCGMGHLLDIVTLWYPIYWVTGFVRACTALVSVYTAFELLTLLPKFLTLTSPLELAEVNQKLQSEIHHRRNAQVAFQSLVTCTSLATGTEYFSTLVISLAMILNVDSVIVAERCESDALALNILGMWHYDQHPIDSLISAAQTPCVQVLETAKLHYCSDLELPPDHPMGKLTATTYLGAPLLDGDGNAIGILFILHNGLLEELELAKSFLRVFAARSAAELRRHQAEQALQRAYDNLEERIQQRTIELKEAKETAEIANRAKSLFLAKVSHELRTPLNAILGFTQLISQDQTLSKDHSESLEIIDTSSAHLLDLINNILEFTQLEIGHAQLHTDDVDIISVLYGLGNMVRLKAKKRGLQLRVDCDPNIPRYLHIDAGKLRQIILNLLDNAIKYTDTGQVVLKAYAIPSDDVFNLGLEISDTGTGISLQEQQRIFSPFYQTDASSTVHDASDQGVGLGLAICQGLLKLMDGSIQCLSYPGQGTTFHIQLPVEVIQAPQKAPPITKKISTPPQQQYNILVVEDAPTNRRLLKHILGNAGFIVHEAENGQQAIEQWQSQRPDLILMDIQMPVMNGYDATAHIKQRDPNLPIIAITASVLDNQLDKILSVGCNACIRKPVNREHLLCTINNCLNTNHGFTQQSNPSQVLA
ncbi:response regulator [Adonisia turfae]|uniref:Circadian input-output histidine kinase CikA n=1 Tax=Adonisia turfae CCMR0081 TaxID=2292702 RepID=A0A6M0RIX1_9CYAN|nr:response regulator [Adonisia turfae]NEZ55742.1 response regulator [Adonisia turfae CCMR0081]